MIKIKIWLIINTTLIVLWIFSAVMTFIKEGFFWLVVMLITSLIINLTTRIKTH